MFLEWDHTEPFAETKHTLVRELGPKCHYHLLLKHADAGTSWRGRVRGRSCHPTIPGIPATPTHHLAKPRDGPSPVGAGLHVSPRAIGVDGFE